MKILHYRCNVLFMYLNLVFNCRKSIFQKWAGKTLRHNGRLDVNKAFLWYFILLRMLNQEKEKSGKWIQNTRAAILGRVMRWKIDSWNWAGSSLESSRPYGIPEMLISKAGIYFVIWSSLSHPRESIPWRISHKESILWHRCLRSLKV